MPEEPRQELVVPGVGEVVDLNSEVECVRALSAVREFEGQLREAKAQLTFAIAERAKVLGTQTLNLPDGSKAEVRGGQETTYDALEVENRLRELGMPEERIREIVLEEVSYRVSAREAKRAAAANEEYAAAIESAKTITEKQTYITISKSR